MNDSIHSYIDRNNTATFEKKVLIADKKELIALNSQLADDLAYIKGNPKIIIKEKIVIKHDTLEVESIVYIDLDSNIIISWDLDTAYDDSNYRRLSGNTKLFNLDSNLSALTYITRDEIGISLLTGLSKTRDGYEIFVKSNYPGFKINNLEGAIIDRKMITTNDDAIVFGPSLGYGLVFHNNTVNYGFIIGVTATYNINKHVKKLFNSGL